MRHLRTFESFASKPDGYPSESEMMAHLCDCGFTTDECNDMTYDEMCDAYDQCTMMTTYEAKKAKPDFLDLDRDGNKKESMKKAAKDKKAAQGKDDFVKKFGSKKEKEEDEKPARGAGKLTAAQKKLPPALQKAILKRKK